MDPRRIRMTGVRGSLLNALEAEAGFAQGVTDGGYVGCAAGFDGDVMTVSPRLTP